MQLCSAALIVRKKWSKVKQEECYIFYAAGTLIFYQVTCACNAVPVFVSFAVLIFFLGFAKAE